MSFSGGSPVGGVLGLEGVSYPPHALRRVFWSVAVPGASVPCKQLSFAISHGTCDRHCDGAFGEQDLVVLGASNLGFGPDKEAFLRRQSLQRWGGARSQGLGPGDPWWGADTLSGLRLPASNLHLQPVPGSRPEWWGWRAPHIPSGLASPSCTEHLIAPNETVGLGRGRGACAVSGPSVAKGSSLWGHGSPWKGQAHPVVICSAFGVGCSHGWDACGQPGCDAGLWRGARGGLSQECRGPRQGRGRMARVPGVAGAWGQDQSRLPGVRKFRS